MIFLFESPSARGPLSILCKNIVENVSVVLLTQVRFNYKIHIERWMRKFSAVFLLIIIFVRKKKPPGPLKLLDVNTPNFNLIVFQFSIDTTKGR